MIRLSSIDIWFIATSSVMVVAGFVVLSFVLHGTIDGVDETRVVKTSSVPEGDLFE